ncbi:hypothetical protein EUGRSUZ_F03421 [Eucalyptus grandis]|uniref:Uncharacterized protein n=2 Tax=Eucalyptus grandis TaxID=71139 RepID=A0ACC3KNJ0_EUCGR|nr:hypothetical protein EUGRSUZ_F03421 [Eucalyptus grandis]
MIQTTGTGLIIILKTMFFRYFKDIAQVKLIFSNQTGTIYCLIPSHTQYVRSYKHSKSHGLRRFPTQFLFTQ